MSPRNELVAPISTPVTLKISSNVVAALGVESARKEGAVRMCLDGKKYSTNAGQGADSGSSKGKQK